MTRPNPTTTFLGLPLNVAGLVAMQDSVKRGFQLIDAATQALVGVGVSAEQVTYGEGSVAETLDSLRQRRSGVFITVPAPYNVAQGGGVYLSPTNLFGIATHAALLGAPVRIQTQGIVTVAKNPTGAVTLGSLAAYDVDAQRVDANLGVAEWFMGCYVAAAGDGVATARVKLIPQ